jgi:hypothetical protein
MLGHAPASDYNARAMTTFEYISVLLSIIVGLGVTHLLGGIGRIINEPRKYTIYWVHMVWVVWLFMMLIFFWWVQFQLVGIELWRFEHYLVIVLYAVLLYLFAVVLMPRYRIEEGDFRRYYMDRRRWLTGFVWAWFIIDVLDTWLKGTEHFDALMPDYFIVWGGLLLTASSILFTQRQWVQALAAIGLLFWQAFWIYSYFGTASPTPV